MSDSHQSAIVLVFDRGANVLSLRRSRTDKWKPGFWNFPGGRVEPGEGPRAAAARELTEESGICLGPETLRWAFSYRETRHLVHVFWTKLIGRLPVKFLDGEHDAAAWTALHQIPQPSVPGVRFIVEQVSKSAWNLAPLDTLRQHSTRSSSWHPSTLAEQTRTRESHYGGYVEPWPDWFRYWPKSLPFPIPLQRNRGPVPNRQSVDWPQAQFAPLYLPPGSPSFQAFRFPDRPVTRVQPLYRLEGDAFPYLHSMVGPDGDIAQVPTSYSYGDNMSYAQYNQGLLTFTPGGERADQLLDAPAGVPGVPATIPEPVLTPLDVARVQEAEIATAAVVAADEPFEPFAPELLVGLKDALLQRIQKLESVITKLSAQDRGPALEQVYDGLLKAHDKIEKRLEKRLEKRERKKGRLGKAKTFLKKLHRRKAVHKARKDEGKEKKIQDIKTAYQAGSISRERAKNLVGAVVKPGKQLEHPKVVAARIAAKARAAGGV